MERKENTTYCGWKNYETWNVALWLDNDRILYNRKCDYRKAVNEGKVKKSYEDFIDFARLREEKTGDDVLFTDSRIDREEIIAFIFED